MSRFIENADLIVEGGTLYVAVQDAQRVVDRQHEDLSEKFRDRAQELEAKYGARLDALRKEANAFNAKWCEAEEKLARAGRAEEAMRSYELTISDQAREIEHLKTLIPPKKGPPKAKQKRVAPIRKLDEDEFE